MSLPQFTGEKAPLMRPPEPSTRTPTSTVALVATTGILLYLACITTPSYFNFGLQRNHISEPISLVSSLDSIEASRVSKDGITGRLPALGWNSWNQFGCDDINEDVFIKIGKKLVSTGLKDLGYEYVNIDDCWSNKTHPRDNKTHEIRVDNVKFPNGIKHVADKIHDLGLKIGIYSDAGALTCAGYVGSLGYEEVDAAQWSRWGIDYLKYDNCNVPERWRDEYDWFATKEEAVTGLQTLGGGAPPEYDWSKSNTSRRYNFMRDALESQDRMIQYGLCPWGVAHVDTWGNRTGQSWRMFADIFTGWSGRKYGASRGITDIINHASFNYKCTDFFGHGDWDMLEVGNGDLTIEENRSHFALWAALKSPLIIGTSLHDIKPEILKILSNKDLLDFNQDPHYGRSASPYKWGVNPDHTYNDTHPAEFWSGRSTKGIHVFILNTLDHAVHKAAMWKEVPGLNGNKSYRVRDMWSGKDLGIFEKEYKVKVASHDTIAIRINEIEGMFPE